jgi:carbamoyltransferase
MISLGISYRLHDSAACIVKDGELMFAVAEERLTRKKHDGQFPANAIAACLAWTGLEPDDLDFVCFGWPPPYKEYVHDLKNTLLGKQNRAYLRGATLGFLTMWAQQGGAKRFAMHFGPVRAKMCKIDHHLAHAISAYAYSGFTEATVLVVDGRGAWEATSVWHGHDGRIEHVATIPWPNSLGLFYAEFTHYLGFAKYTDEWKVMGLAPYGTAGVSLGDFIRLEEAAGLPYEVNADRLLGTGADDVSGIESILGPRRFPDDELDSRHQDIARAVQQTCEAAIHAVVRFAIEKTNCRHLCLAGGVALNSKANGKLLSSGLIDDIFVQPASADDGVALGAALAPYLSAESLPITAMRHVCLGREFSDEEIGHLLETYKLRYSRVDDPGKAGAQMLADGKIVGWFQGREEFGPRALGSRSILADPRDALMKEKVNDVVKFREPWRPFAPSLLAESAEAYLQDSCDSPFMILTSQVERGKQSVIPAVTHVDGSTRPQTVERQVLPLYWRLIKAFEDITGVPAVLNTSFNLRGEPIVSSPTDAIRTFFSSGLDALMIGTYIVEK